MWLSKYKAWLCASILACLPYGLSANTHFECYERGEKQYSSKVIGGTPQANTLQIYPWMVSLHQDGEAICGGSLINSNLVLTAAHCVMDDTGQLMKKPIIKQAAADGSSHGEQRQVADIVVHEAYEPSNLANDIALLRLEQAFAIPSHKIIRMLNPKTAKTWGLANDCAKAIGWGLDDNDQPTDIIREVNLKIHSDRHCQQHWQSDAGKLPAYIVCAGYDTVKKDVCRGDSGGPLFVRGGLSQYLLLGLVSWGEQCNQAVNRFGAYTRVADFNAWIHATATRMGN